LLFGAGMNCPTGSNAISDSMFSGYSQAKIQIGKMIGLEYCMYNGNFIQSFRMMLDSGLFSDPYVVGFDWIDQRKIECKQMKNSFGEIDRISFTASGETNRVGYKLLNIGIGGGQKLRLDWYDTYENTAMRDTKSMLINIKMSTILSFNRNPGKYTPFTSS